MKIYIFECPDHFEAYRNPDRTGYLGRGDTAQSCVARAKENYRLQTAPPVLIVDTEEGAGA